MMPAATFHHVSSCCSGVYGTWQLWQSSRTFRLFIIYLLVVLSFYAVVEDIRGSRQRAQLSFIFAWVQFQFLWSLRPGTRCTRVAHPSSERQYATASRRHPLVTPT